MKTRRASIVISFEKLARVLNLKPGISISGAAVDLSTETLQLFIKGESLPTHERKQQSYNISLTELMDVDPS